MEENNQQIGTRKVAMYCIIMYKAQIKPYKAQIKPFKITQIHLDNFSAKFL